MRHEGWPQYGSQTDLPPLKRDQFGSENDTVSSFLAVAQTLFGEQGDG
jgi:hypothetical protein